MTILKPTAGLGLAGLLLLMSLSFDAHSAKHALLVGVTEYPNLLGANLKGPANDADLAATVLKQRGFSEDDIVVLSDSPLASGEPTKQNIMAQLDRIATNAARGDFVYLHFGGHGSQQPTDDPEELDGRDEIFLPKDVSGWDRSIGSVKNAITDNEMGQKLDAIRSKGANVWLVFDSCHSGTMSRGVAFEDIHYRQLPEGALQIPADSGVKSRGADTEKERNAFVPDKVGQPSWGYLVAFSAAQPNQTTPEMNLPAKGESRQPHGIFTFHMMETLSRYKGITYRQLAQQLSEQYRQLPWRRTQPLISGTALDETIFGEQATGAVAWPATKGKRGAIAAEAGFLHQYSPGALVELYDSPLLKDENIVGIANVTEATAVSSSLMVIDGDESKLPKNLYTLLRKPSTQFGLSVAATGPGAATIRPLVEKAIAGNPLLTMADPKALPDIRVANFENHWWFLTSDQSLPCEYQGITNASLLAECTATRTAQDIVNAADLSKSNPEAGLNAIRQALNSIARAESIVRLQEQLPTGQPGIATTMTITTPSGEAPYPDTETPVFYDGDVVSIIIKNNGFKAQDVSILYRDAHYGITQLWPESGEANRVQPGQELPTIEIELFPDPTGEEDLIVLSQPGEGISKDFAFLEQPPLGSLSRGSLGPTIEEDKAPPLLTLLMDSAANSNTQSGEAAAVRMRGASRSRKADLGGMQVIRWKLSADERPESSTTDTKTE